MTRTSGPKTLKPGLGTKTKKKAPKARKSDAYPSAKKKTMRRNTGY